MCPDTGAIKDIVYDESQTRDLGFGHKSKVAKMVEGTMVVESGTFSGKPATITVHVHPADSTRLGLDRLKEV
jgi:hypothetical protein